MYVKLHRYHWYIQGSHFFQLHDLFEEMYELFAKQLDETAERILMINGKPLATMASYIKEASLVEASADDKEKEILMQLQDDLNQLITEIHDLGLRAAHDNRDEVTIDMLIGFQQYYEKMLWMSKAYLHQL